MILVTGATGYIGRHIVRRLLADGYQVRCLLPLRLQKDLPWEGDETQPEIITGTLLDEEALFAAATGTYTIIHLESAQWWGRPRDFERVELVGTRNVIAAARAARVGRIITVSHLGVAPSSAFTLLRNKGLVEGLIRDSGLAYTILRSGVVFGPEDHFFNHIAMMLAMNPFVFFMPGQGEVILHPLYIDDLVEAVVRSLDRIETVDETLEFGGPEYMTFRDLVHTVMRVTGIYRYLIPLEPYLLRWYTNIMRFVIRRTLMTPQWMDYLAASRTAHLGNTYNYFGFHPRRFEDTLLTYMPQQRYFLPGIREHFRRRPRGF